MVGYHFIKSTVLIHQLLVLKNDQIVFIYLEISYTREEQLLQMSVADVLQ